MNQALNVTNPVQLLIDLIEFLLKWTIHNRVNRLISSIQYLAVDQVGEIKIIRPWLFRTNWSNFGGSIAKSAELFSWVVPRWHPIDRMIGIVSFF